MKKKHPVIRSILCFLLVISMTIPSLAESVGPMVYAGEETVGLSDEQIPEMTEYVPDDTADTEETVSEASDPETPGEEPSVSPEEETVSENENPEEPEEPFPLENGNGGESDTEYADDPMAETPETEEPVEESAAPVLSETEDPLPSPTPEPHIPEDITEQVEQLKLNLGNAWYQISSGEQIGLVEGTGEVNFSEMDPQNAEYLGFSLLFRLRKEGEERTVKAGDWFKVPLPQEFGPAQILPEANVTAETDEGLKVQIASACAEAGFLRVVFTEAVENPEYAGIHGEIVLAFQMNQDLIKTEPSVYTCLLQEGNTYTIVLPAAKIAAEEKSEEDMEEIPETKTLTASQTSLLGAEVPDTAEVDDEEEEHKPSAEGVDGHASLTVKWLDNPQQKHENSRLTSQLKLYFSFGEEEMEFARIREDGLLTLTEDAKKQLNIETVSEKAVLCVSDMIGSSVYEIENLPDRMENASGEENAIRYRLALAGSYRAHKENGMEYYICTRAGSNEIYMIPTESFSADIHIHDGDIGRILTAENIRDNFTMHGLDAEGNPMVCQLNRDYGIRILEGNDAGSELPAGGWSMDGCTITVTGLPSFTCSQTPITWEMHCLTREEVTGDSSKDRAQLVPEAVGVADPRKDYYRLEYDNAESPNQGSQTKACYNGGTIHLTLSGPGSFHAYKIWLDDESAERPSITWGLWRYSPQNGGNYKKASVIYDDTGKAAECSPDNTAPSGVKIEITKGDFGPIRRFPKYDSDGQAYVYFVREYSEGGDTYEQVFGEVLREEDENGNMVFAVKNDKCPGNVREEEDVSLYDGGILSNRHIGTVTPKWKKTWMAAAHQSELEDVYVEMTLQSRVLAKEGQEAQAYADTEVIRYVSGFSAEQLTRPVEAKMPRYDALGRELEYRWAETAVYQGSDLETAMAKGSLFLRTEGGEQILDENGCPQFLLNHSREENGELLEDGEEHYISVVDEEQGVITNQLVGSTSYILEKIWKDETGAEITDPDKLKGFCATFDLVYKVLDGGYEPYGTYTLTSETGWRVAIENLPKYDPRGVKYYYFAMEKTYTTPDGKEYRLDDCQYNETLTADRVFTETGTAEKTVTTNNTARVVNVPSGIHKQIKIRKDWLDDGDSGCRKPVYVDVWREADPEGKYPKAKVAERICLSEKTNWENARVDVTEYLVDGIPSDLEMWKSANPDRMPGAEDIYQDGSYYIVEVQMGEDVSVHEEDTEQGTVSRQYGIPCTQYSLFPDTAADAAQGERGSYIGTEEHIYYIDYPSYTDKSSEDIEPDNPSVDPYGYYVVTNRRVGTVNLEVTKTWVDGGRSMEERASFEASIELLPGDAETEIGFSEDGTEVILNGLETVPQLKREILDKAGQPVNRIQKLKGGSIVTSENGTAVETNTETICFYNLPKYDVHGKVVHYRLVENDSEGLLKQNDYGGAAEVLETSYEEGPAQHTEDLGQYSVTNKVSGTKTAAFHKLWKDAWRFERGERPDIYLTLYQSINGKAPEPSGYKPVKWSKDTTEEEDNTLVSVQSDYEWTCEFRNLPKYDEEGYEIQYYAWEGMLVNYSKLDYLAPRYWYGQKGAYADYSEVTPVYKNDGILGVSYSVENRDKGETDEEGNPLNIVMTASDGKQVLKESGTFVNQIRNVVRIDGTKIWKNVPNSFAASELPVLRLYLLRSSGALCEQNQVSSPVYLDNGQPDVPYDEVTGEPLTGASSVNGWEYSACIREVKSDHTDVKFRLNFAGENNQYGQALDESGQAVSDEAVIDARLAKYDENGNLYTYCAAETVVSDAEHISEAYPVGSSRINAYLIENTYDGGGGTLTVDKEWIVPEDWTQIRYPKAKYSLYWRYQKKTAVTDESGNSSSRMVWSDLKLADVQDDEFANPLVYNANSDATSEMVFRNLPIYAANGSEYEYYIVENTVGGYVRQDVGSGYEDKKITDTKDMEEVCSEIRKLNPNAAVIAGPFYPASEEEKGPDHAEPDIRFRNEYRNPQNHFRLTGTKQWEDYSNTFATRPEVLTTAVYRRAARDTGTAIEKELLFTATGDVSSSDDAFVWGEAIVSSGRYNHNPIQVSWSDTDTDTWTYAISGLDQYAVNGELWEYLVEEITADGAADERIRNYDPESRNSGWVCAPVKKQDSSSEPGEENSADLGSVSAAKALRNDLYTSHTVQKKWENFNRNMQMDEVTMKLQVKEADGTWMDAAEYFGPERDYEIPYPEWEVTLASKSADDTPSYKWEKLPKRYLDEESGTFLEFSYRAVEVKIGEERIPPFSEENLEAGIYASGGNDNYTITAQYSSTKTVIVNAISGNNQTSLCVKKYWQGDHQNQFGLRPMKNGNWTVSMEIWKRPLETMSGLTQEQRTALDQPVKDRTGKGKLTVTISGSADTDQGEATVSGLPKKTYVSLEEGNGTEITWQYYAKEVIAENSVLKKNYFTEYPQDGEGQEILSEQKADGTFGTDITNRLDTCSISGTKIWEDNSNSGLFRPTSDEIQLILYARTAGTNIWSRFLWQPQENGMPELRWEENADVWTWEIAGLPKTDPSGNAYSYSVEEKRTDGYLDPVYSGEDSSKALDEESITNTQTCFTLNKTGEQESGRQNLNHTTLVFRGTAAGGVDVRTWTLTWTRDANGKESYRVTKKMETDGGKSEIQITCGSASEGAVSITGLPVGTYELTDESVLPKGYETAGGRGYCFTLAGDGTVTADGSDGDFVCSAGKVSVNDRQQSLIIHKQAAGGGDIPDQEGLLLSVTGCFRETDSTLTEKTTKYISGSEQIPADQTQVLRKGDLAAGEKYELKEETAPVGYRVSDAVYELVMAEDGTVRSLTKISGSDDSAYVQQKNGKNSDTVIFENDPVSISLKKVTALDGGAPLEGAEFTLEKKTEDGWVYLKDTDTIPLQTSRLTDAAAGCIFLDGPEFGLEGGGTYRITEVKAAEGYVLWNTPVEFIIEKNGNVTDSGKNSFVSSGGYAAVGESRTEILVKNDPIQITLTKKDGTDEAVLSGVEFTLTDETAPQGTGSPWKLTTDQNGVITLRGDAPNGQARLLQNHSYTLTETKQAGYHIPEPLYFTVNENGEAVFASGTAENYTYDSDAHTGVTVRNERETGSIRIRKVNTDGEALCGAVFGLFHGEQGDIPVQVLNGKVVPDGTEGAHNYTVTTSDGLGSTVKGEAVFENLLWDTYVIRELVPPEGYQLTTATRTAQIHAQKLTYSFTSDTGNTMIINEKNRISIQKVTQDGSVSLSGAVFTLCGEFANTEKLPQELASGEYEGFQAEYDEEQKTLKWISQADRPFVLSGHLIGGKTYVLEEVSAPAGYEKTETVTVKMSDEGMLSLEPEKPLNVVQDGNVVSVRNRPVEMRIIKADENGMPVLQKEYTFTITPKEGSAFRSGAAFIEITQDPAAQTRLDSELIAGNTYVISETKAPAGYEQAADITFRVMEDGTLTQEDGRTALPGTTDAGGVITLTIQDHPVEMDLIKRDADRPDDTLPTGNDRIGYAVFRITPASGCSFAESMQTYLEVTTDPDADNCAKKVLYRELTAGQEYMIEEIAAPDGYELERIPLTVHVENDGTLTPVRYGTEAYEDGKSPYSVSQNDDGTAVIAMYDRPVAVDLLKTDALDEQKNALGNEVIGYAEFEVSCVDGSFAELDETTVRVTTDSDAENHIAKQLYRQLIYGKTYSIKEIAAPKGYQLNEELFFFRVEEDGSLTPVSGEENDDTQTEDHAEETAYSVMQDSDGKALIVMKDLPVVLDIRKKDADDPEGETIGNTQIHYAEFSVSGNFAVLGADTAVSVTTDPASENYVRKILYAQLMIGETYHIQETFAPYGYECSSSVLSFRVEKDGSADLLTCDDMEYQKDQSPFGYEKKDGAICLTMQDKKTGIRLEKADIRYPEHLLDGAEFRIDGQFADGETTKSVVLRGEDGVAEITGLDGLWIYTDPDAEPEDKVVYTLTETKAPAGYELPSVSLRFTVSPSGNVVPEEASDGAVYLCSEETIVVYDTPVEIRLSKVAAENKEKELSGAEFVISGSFADGTSKKEKVTAETISGLDGLWLYTPSFAEEGEWNTYTLTETKSPDGYRVLPEEAECSFLILPDGTIRLLSDGDGALTLWENGTEIQVADEQTELLILKQDENGKALSGACLAIVDEEGTTVDIWNTDGKAHEVTGKLTVGKEYTLIEAAAPQGYLLSSDIKFVMDSRMEPLVMVDKKDTEIKVPPRGKITVTKVTQLAGEVQGFDEVYYVALFRDADLSSRVSEVKALAMNGHYSCTVEFDDLDMGTYYVAETTDAGLPLDSIEGFLDISISSREVVLNSAQTDASSVIVNHYQDLPPSRPMEKDGKICVVKTVQDAEGKEASAENESFWVALFADAEYTEMVRPPMEIVMRNQNYVEFEELPAGTYYVAEVYDENGVVIREEDEAYQSFGYEPVNPDEPIEIEPGGMEYETNVINILPEEPKEEPAISPTAVITEPAAPAASNKNPADNTTKANAARTGDETSVLAWMLLMVFAASGAMGIGRKKIRRREGREK
ncbi:MAG: Cna B-type domain-containing protein [Blautia sp.]|nr:Cna B-type domain-containing protein [Blautia sp.]MDY5030756.1 SpaA isopeptide-forming pilin-related protein [Blautia sp.]